MRPYRCFSCGRYPGDKHKLTCRFAPGRPVKMPEAKRPVPLHFNENGFLQGDLDQPGAGRQLRELLGVM